jgi:hypothetical protein
VRHNLLNKQDAEAHLAGLVIWRVACSLKRVAFFFLRLSLPLETLCLY